MPVSPLSASAPGFSGSDRRLARGPVRVARRSGCSRSRRSRPSISLSPLHITNYVEVEINLKAHRLTALCIHHGVYRPPVVLLDFGTQQLHHLI
jgi:hypothetical protein